MQHEHYTHTAPDIPSSTALSIFVFLLYFLLMQLLFFLLVPFQDFLHSLLCSRPILHFQFDLLLKITHTPCPESKGHRHCSFASTNHFSSSLYRKRSCPTIMICKIRGMNNAGTGYQNPAPALFIVIILTFPKYTPVMLVQG